MSLAWFFLPRALKDDVFTLHGSLAFALVLAAWMYSDVPATNVLAPDRQRVMAAIDEPVRSGFSIRRKATGSGSASPACCSSSSAWS